LTLYKKNPQEISDKILAISQITLKGQNISAMGNSHRIKGVDFRKPGKGETKGVRGIAHPNFQGFIYD
jgi:hypothetical protein